MDFIVMEFNSFKSWVSTVDKMSLFPEAVMNDGSPGLDNPQVIDTLNSQIFSATESTFVTPYVALEYIRKVVAWAGISIPAILSLEGEFGEEIFKLGQFGVEPDELDEQFYIYFSWELQDDGQYAIYSQIVTEEELADLLSDTEFYDEMEEDLEESTGKTYFDVAHSPGKEVFWIFKKNGMFDMEHVKNGAEMSHFDVRRWAEDDANGFTDEENLVASGRFNEKDNDVSIAISFHNIPNSATQRYLTKKLNGILHRKFGYAKQHVFANGKNFASLDDFEQKEL